MAVRSFLHIDNASLYYFGETFLFKSREVFLGAQTVILLLYGETGYETI